MDKRLNVHDSVSYCGKYKAVLLGNNSVGYPQNFIKTKDNPAPYSFTTYKINARYTDDGK